MLCDKMDDKGDKKEWMRAEIEELNHMFYDKPELWDVTCNIYRDRVRKQNALTKMADKFNTTVHQIQTKLHNLRNQFNRESKKKQNDKIRSRNR